MRSQYSGVTGCICRSFTGLRSSTVWARQTRCETACRNGRVKLLTSPKHQSNLPHCRLPAGRDRRPGSDKLTNAKTTRATDDEDGHSPLRVCYFGTYREEYTRNKILINGLRAQGVEVIECHCKFWMEFDLRHNLATGGWSNPWFLWRDRKSVV